MANKIVQLIDKDGDNIYPVSATPFSNCYIETGTVAATTVGTSWVTLKTLTVPQDGTYLVWSHATRSGNYSAGCLISMRIMKGEDEVMAVLDPTVANYAGNHEAITTIVGAFTASSGDTVTIQIRKDRTNYGANLGCKYLMLQVE